MNAVGTQLFIRDLLELSSLEIYSMDRVTLIRSISVLQDYLVDHHVLGSTVNELVSDLPLKDIEEMCHSLIMEKDIRF